MDFKEVERNFEVKTNSVKKTMMVDADVNEKLFGIKKPSKEDKKSCKRRRERKTTEIWNTEIEDVENNNRNKAVDSSDKNLCIDVSGSDICESICLGKVEDDDKICSFICNGKSTGLETIKMCKE